MAEGGILIIPFFILVLILLAIKATKKSSLTRPYKKTPVQFPERWRAVLIAKIGFYNALSANEKKRFEFKVAEFLANCKIVGVDEEISYVDKLLVAASAIIPIFNFPNWQYVNLQKVYILPDAFNSKFQSTGNDRRILGAVGSGPMEGKMVLSKKALRHGFSNDTDKQNTAVHEFVHLIDKMDGKVDGIPKVLLKNSSALPWLELINKKIEEIVSKDSDINPYGATNQAEFFSVASEYFFERPDLLEKKHPELYAILERVFNHEMKNRNLRQEQQTREIHRNDPCPCGSGKKYKRCCGMTA